jgi:alkylation response protein AidB-like acyl-CoA dehydrogenase
MAFDLSPTEEQQALRETLHGFAREVIRPAARDCESAGRTSDRIRAQLHEIGVVAPVPEEHGGAGSFDALTMCIAAEELAWGDAGIASDVLAGGVAATVIAEAGTDEQRSKYLGRFVEAFTPSFVALGERFSGGDLDALETRIDEGKVVGEKYGVPHAADAPFGIVVGRSADALAAVVVESGSFEVVKSEDKLGLEAAPTYVVRVDGQAEEIPAGPELTTAILRAKLLTGAIALGSARASYEYAADYAKEREAFGRPIGAFQAISFKIADMAIDVDAARLSIWRAAWLLDRGEATQHDILEANAHAIGAAIRAGDDGVQVLGGHGYIRDHPVEMWFRNAVTLSVFDAPELLADVVVGADALSGGGR